MADLDEWRQFAPSTLPKPHEFCLGEGIWLRQPQLGDSGYKLGNPSLDNANGATVAPLPCYRASSAKLEGMRRSRFGAPRLASQLVPAIRRVSGNKLATSDGNSVRGKVKTTRTNMLSMRDSLPTLYPHRLRPRRSRAMTKGGGGG